jgi:hypothetical protein
VSGARMACSLVVVLLACSNDKSCPAPNILRYEQPGCDAAPVCGSREQDAGARLLCGCDGQTWSAGSDYSVAPWRTIRMCPDDCFSPTHSAQAAPDGRLRGCPCDPAKDAPVCRKFTESAGGGTILFQCLNGAWSVASYSCP